MPDGATGPVITEGLAVFGPTREVGEHAVKPYLWCGGPVNWVRHDHPFIPWVG